MLNKSLKSEKGVNLKKICDVVTQCINTWKSLPGKFQSNRHYSLLQLIQQLKELVEAEKLISPKQWKSVPEFMKNIESVSSSWQECSYLYSDEFLFVNELFHIRQTYLKDLYTKFSFSPQEKLDKAKPTFRNYVADIAAHGSNDAVMELCSLSLKFQNRNQNSLL